VSRPASRRTKEELLLLAVAVVATGGAVVSVRDAAPPEPGLWLATSGALALALAGMFAFWFGGAARRRMSDSLDVDRDAARALLAAIPTGIVLVRDGSICSVNRSVCETLGFVRDDLLAATAPFPFWPPEHRHEIEAFHTELAALGEHTAQLTFLHGRGDRLSVLVSGRIVSDASGTRQVLAVHDISAGHRRERRLAELAVRDLETGLLDRRAFEDRLGVAVRRAVKADANVAVVLAELSSGEGRASGVLGRPEGLLVVERLQQLARAEDELARVGDAELGVILPETDAEGAVRAVERWRAALAPVAAVEVTAGVCDLATAGDALSLYALADRALAAARRTGRGSTERHVSPLAGGPARGS
jgi:PAS domain S-box-containing protein/diguanylate cyclase (GGDEF)-like protein